MPNQNNIPIIPGHTILFDKYKILNRLASGGFGNTFTACLINASTSDQEIYLVKQLHRMDKPAIRLFEREGSNLAKLTELNIGPFPKLFASANNIHVMEYIKGSTLEESIDNRDNNTKVSAILNNTIKILDSLLRICRIIHSKGLIHRDIKPSNIIIDIETLFNPTRLQSPLYLIDFGGSKFIHDQDDNELRQTLTPFFTLGFCAPEQISGHADFYSDLYACGKVAAYYLDKKYPNWDDSNDWEIPQWINSDHKLIEIIKQLTKKDVSLRIQTAEDAIRFLNIHNMNDLPEKITQFRLEYSSLNLPGTAAKVLRILINEKIAVRRMFIGTTQFIDTTTEGARAIFKISKTTEGDVFAYADHIERRVKRGIIGHLKKLNEYSLFQDVKVSVRPINQTRRFHFSIQAVMIDKIGTINKFLEGLRSIKIHNTQLGIAALIAFPLYIKKDNNYSNYSQSYVDMKCFVDDNYFYDALSEEAQIIFAENLKNKVCNYIKNSQLFTEWSFCFTNPNQLPVLDKNETILENIPEELGIESVRWRLEYQSTNIPGISSVITKVLRDSRTNIRRAYIGETGIGTDGVIRSSSSRGRFTIILPNEILINQLTLEQNIRKNIFEHYKSFYEDQNYGNLKFNEPKIIISDAGKFNKFYFSSQLIVKKDCTKQKLTEILNELCIDISKAKGIIWHQNIGENFSVEKINIEQISCFCSFVPLDNDEIGKTIIDIRFGFSEHWAYKSEPEKQLIARTVQEWFIENMKQMQDCVDVASCKSISPEKDNITWRKEANESSQPTCSDSAL